ATGGLRFFGGLMICRFVSAGLLSACFVAAAPTLTTIQDVLYKANGTRFSGTLTISWNTFESADSATIVMQTETVKVIDGNLRLQLVPSATATPPAYYRVIYNSDGRIQFRETWSVPASATPLRIRDVRIASGTPGGGDIGGGDTGGGGSAGGGGAGSLTDPIPESQVIGLLADIAVRPVKGPAFAAGRTAVVDASGLIESAT